MDCEVDIFLLCVELYFIWRIVRGWFDTPLIPERNGLDGMNFRKLTLSLSLKLIYNVIIFIIYFILYIIIIILHGPFSIVFKIEKLENKLQ